jgi:hypothetical protein
MQPTARFGHHLKSASEAITQIHDGLCQQQTKWFGSNASQSMGRRTESPRLQDPKAAVTRVEVALLLGFEHGGSPVTRWSAKICERRLSLRPQDPKTAVEAALRALEKDDSQHENHWMETSLSYSSPIAKVNRRSHSIPFFD